jgi:Uma2 family endonuclease
MSPTLTPPAALAAARNGEEALYEVVNGLRVEVPPMGALAGFIASVLHEYLGPYVRQHRLGWAVVEVLFELSPQGPLQRRPDVAFVSVERTRHHVAAEGDPPVWRVVPNLAVEVVSPSNTAAEIQDKLNDYFRHGVQLVWVIYPQHRLVYVYESVTRNRILTEADELTGEPAVPGFRLRVGELFASVPPVQ